MDSGVVQCQSYAFDPGSFASIFVYRFFDNADMTMWMQCLLALLKFWKSECCIELIYRSLIVHESCACKGCYHYIVVCTHCTQRYETLACEVV